MKLKFIYSIIAFVFANQTFVAQNKISGNIKDDQTNEILTGVSIYISDLKTGTSTDQKGNYQLENIKTGTYLFEISFNGYKKRVERIYINKDTVVDFLISQSVSELNEVVVTAVSHSTELKGSIYAWQDKRKGQYDIYAHHLNAFGLFVGLNAY